MRRLILDALLVACVMMFTVSCETEGTVDPAFKNHFIKYYGDDGNQEAKDFVVNADGTIMMVGTSIETTGRKRVYLVKVDTEGNVVWDKKIGGINDEVVMDIEPIINGPDAGNFILLSNYKKNIIDSMAIRLTVVSQSGDSLKSFLFDYYASQSAYSITALQSGAYYVSGKTTRPNPISDPDLVNIENLLIIHIQSNFTYTPDGVTVVNTPTTGSAIKVIQMSSSQFYYGGYNDAVIPGYALQKSNFLFGSFENNPSAIPPNYSGSSDNSEFMTGIVQSLSGQFMAVGTLEIGNNKTLVATRVSSSFQTVSPMQNILSNAEGVSVAASGASDFLILGNSISGAGNRDIIVRKIDSAFGDLLTLRFGSSNNDDTGSAIAELPNGDILILGTMELVNQKKMALIKVKPNGKF